jgi:hypothetical protein
MRSIAVAFSIFAFLFLPGQVRSDLDSREAICLTSEEELLYALIMDYRRANDLPAIPVSEKLTQVAKVHALDLTTNYIFDPNDKCNPHSWSEKGNWAPCCYTGDHSKAKCMWDKPGEIAGYKGNGYEIVYYSSAGANAKEGLDGWKISPGHNPLLINTGIWKTVEWKAIGIAIYKEYGIVWFGDVADETRPGKCD